MIMHIFNLRNAIPRISLIQFSQLSFDLEVPEECKVLLKTYWRDGCSSCKTELHPEHYSNCGRKQLLTLTTTPTDLSGKNRTQSGRLRVHQLNYWATSATLS